MSAITIIVASLSALALAILILAAIDDRKRQQRLGPMKLGANVDGEHALGPRPYQVPLSFDSMFRSFALNFSTISLGSSAHHLQIGGRFTATRRAIRATKIGLPAPRRICYSADTGL